MRTAIYIVIALAVGLFAGLLLGKQPQYVTTTTTYDTVVYYKPLPTAIAILSALCAYNPAIAISQWLGLFSLEKNQKIAKIIQTINSLAVVVLLILAIILFDQLSMEEEIK